MSVDVIKHKISELKKSIKEYNQYKEYAEEYSKKGTLEGYIIFLEGCMPHMSEGMQCIYMSLIDKSRCGDHKDLLLNLYDRILRKDQYVNKVSQELNISLNKS